jgi:hypothetical protein
MCFANAIPIHIQIPNYAGDDGSNIPQGVMLVTGTDKSCDGFTPWIQGFTPKEHREMLDREEDRKRQERLDKDHREWQEELMNRQAELQGQQAWQLVAIAGILTILAAVVSGLTPILIREMQEAVQAVFN